MIKKTTIGDKLIQVGILPNLKGFQYSVDAIAKYRPGMAMMDVYDWVANINGSTPQRVERALRHAKGKSPTYGHYVNSEFIALMWYELQNEELEAGA